MDGDDVEVCTPGLRLRVGGATGPEVARARVLRIAGRSVHLPGVGGVGYHQLLVPKKSDMVRKLSAAPLEIDEPVTAAVAADAVGSRRPGGIRTFTPDAKREATRRWCRDRRD